MRGFGLVAVLASCTHPAGPAIAAPVGSADAGPAAPVASGTTLTLLDAGAEPRRLLHYPANPPAADVTLRWSADEHYDSQGTDPKRDETVVHLPRTLHGSLVATGPGRVRLELAQGTLDPPATGPEMTLDRLEVEGSGFAAQLPIDVELQLRADGIEPDPIPTVDTGDHDLVQVYSAALFDAIPSRLPSVPVGAGARWRIDVRRGAAVWRTTWTLESIDGPRIRIAATQVEDQRPLSPGFHGMSMNHTDIHASLDLATLAVDATAAFEESGDGYNFEMSMRSQRHAKAALTIAPPSAAAAAP